MVFQIRFHKYFGHNEPKQCILQIVAGATRLGVCVCVCVKNMKLVLKNNIIKKISLGLKIIYTVYVYFSYNLAHRCTRRGGGAQFDQKH